MKPETEAWVRYAENDLAMAGFALEHAMFEQCVYHSQQALEKLLKAIWIEWRTDGSPPRTHNLSRLAAELFPELERSQMGFLQRLSVQYIPSRYADLNTTYTEEQADYYVSRASELYSWLRQQLS